MNVFDILGPVMIGPSSSHTAGAVRIGLVTRALLGSEPKKATILLHGSFARTYKGHGTDKALIGGILGMQTDDPGIRHAREIAVQRGLTAEILTEDIDGAHPNTARISLSDAFGHTVSLQGSSIGGGNIHITEVNHMPVSITGQHTTLIILHRDAPGTIAAVTDVMAEGGINICSFRLSRNQKGGQAVMTIETDGQLTPEQNDAISRLPNIFASTMLLPF